MNHLIAKVSENNEQFKKVISGNTYYEDTEIVDSLVYNPETILDDGQWFKINEFSKKDYSIDIITGNWDSTEYNLIKELDADKIDYLCAYQDEDVYCFQRVFKANFLKRKHITIGDNIKYEKDKSVLVLNDNPDAIYKKSEDCLYFKKLETIAPIFKGIDILYKEATIGDVEEFFKEPFLEVDKEFIAEHVGKANRKRLTLVANTLNNLDENEKKDIFNYTNEYCPELSFDGNKFKINNNEELKILLFGIEERFYTTPVTKEKRAANSVITLNQKK